MRRACPRTTVHVCHLRSPHSFQRQNPVVVLRTSIPAVDGRPKDCSSFVAPLGQNWGTTARVWGQTRTKRQRKQRQECDLGEKGPLNWGPEMWSQEQTLRSPLLKASGTSPLPGTEKKCRCASAAHPHVHTHGLGQSAKQRQPGLGWTGHRTAGQEAPLSRGFSIGDLGQAGTGLPRMLIPSSDRGSGSTSWV